MNCSKCGQPLAPDEQFCGNCGATRSQIDARFSKVEDDFMRLKGQLESGRITRDQFDSALKALMLQDRQGRYWSIGGDTGKWYVHDGQSWIESPPPLEQPATNAPKSAPAPRRTAWACLAGGLALALLAIVVVAVVVVLTRPSLPQFQANVNTPVATFAPLPSTSAPTVPPTIRPPVSTVAVQPSPLPPSPPAPSPLPQAFVAPTIGLTSTARITATVIVPSTPVVTVAPVFTAAPVATAAPSAASGDSVETLLAQAETLTFQSKFADAEAAYQRTIQLNGGTALVFARWARLLSFQGYAEDRQELYAAAVGNAETAVRMAPADGEVAALAARAYHANHVLDKAITSAEIAVRLSPNSADAYAILAEVYLAGKNAVDAEIAAQRALQLDPDSAEGHTSLGLILRAKQQFPEATLEFEKAAQSEPDLVVRQNDLANSYVQIKDYARATAAYQQAIRLYPQSTQAHAGLGRVFLDLKQYDQAIESYTRAIQSNDKSQSGYWGLGMTYYAMGNCPLAVPAFAQVVTLNPAASAAMTYVGWCYLKSGDTITASDWASRSAAIDAANADTIALQSAIAAAQVTPTPAAAPGLYVTRLRLEPDKPTRGQDISFYVQFLNTASGEQNFPWLVFVYRADNPKNPFGQTSTLKTTIPIGTVEQKALGTWKLTGGGGCEDYVARVFWLDEAKKSTQFSTPGGSLFEYAFSVCPP